MKKKKIYSQKDPKKNRFLPSFSMKTSAGLQNSGNISQVHLLFHDLDFMAPPFSVFGT